jgi:hypothetical protein
MAYIGREPQIGNFQICDAISTVNDQAAYTMQVSSVDVLPESANHMIVSLNGVIQKPNSSYTVSGATITFASNLVTGDVINFIQILGNVLDLGVPSDATVSTAKIVDANVTLAKLSATGTKDSTTFLRGDNTFNTELLTPLSSDTQSTPETVLTLSTKYSSTGSNGAAGAGSRLEFKIPDDETNPITGAAIAGLKENSDDSVANAALAFYISQNDTTLDEAMRINSDGDTLIGCTAMPSTSVNGVGFDLSNSSEIKSSIAGTGNATRVRFFNGNGEVGTIRTNGSATAYNTSSDYRLKENVNYDFDATTRLKQLKPARFNFIKDADTTVDGFIAHEVSSIVPEAIHGTKDEVDNNSNPIYQGIDQSKLVPLLVKTIQELEARITQLENA